MTISFSNNILHHGVSSKLRTVAKFIIINFKNRECHMSSSKGSLVITIKRKVNKTSRYRHVVALHSTRSRIDKRCKFLKIYYHPQNVRILHEVLLVPPPPHAGIIGGRKLGSIESASPLVT